MCNLYSLTASRTAIARLFRIADNRAATVPVRRAIFPGHNAPVVRHSEDGARELVDLSWGFVLPQTGKAARRVTNTRDDKILQSSFWRDSFITRRCLIPASSFAEPHDDRTPATWHWFAVSGDQPRPLFAFAGLWKRWHGPIKKDGPIVTLETFSFVTTGPNALTRSINHERSPVILVHEREHDLWLDGSPPEAIALARPIEAASLRIVQESFEKADQFIPN